MIERSWEICQKHKKIRKSPSSDWIDYDLKSLIMLLLTTKEETYYMKTVESKCPECDKEKGGEKEDVEHV